MQCLQKLKKQKKTNVALINYLVRYCVFSIKFVSPVICAMVPEHAFYSTYFKDSHPNSKAALEKHF